MAGAVCVYSRAGQLWVRELDKLEARPADRRLRRAVPVLVARQPADRLPHAQRRCGGWRWTAAPPVRIASYQLQQGRAHRRAACGGSDGTIVFAPAATGSSMMAVCRRSGGEFKRVVRSRDPSDRRRLSSSRACSPTASRCCASSIAPTPAPTPSPSSRGTARVKTRSPAARRVSSIRRCIRRPGTCSITARRRRRGSGRCRSRSSRLETTGRRFSSSPQGSWPQVGSNGDDGLRAKRVERARRTRVAGPRVGRGDDGVQPAVSRCGSTATVARWHARGGHDANARHRVAGRRRRSPASHARPNRRTGQRFSRERRGETISGSCIRSMPGARTPS